MEPEPAGVSAVLGADARPFRGAGWGRGAAAMWSDGEQNMAAGWLTWEIGSGRGGDNLLG